MSLDELAGDFEENVDWLRRKLYGRAPADVGDLLSWMIAVDVLRAPVRGDVAYSWRRDVQDEAEE